jgi:hypothetical protein
VLALGLRTTGFRDSTLVAETHDVGLMSSGGEVVTHSGVRMVVLDRGASAPNTVLVFAKLVGLGVAGGGWGLLARRPKSSAQVT